ncbi:2-dehydropantoate 2-reductase [Histoplasma capsulatum var. duboisii H88]|uniref:2-dehydropantoate 2-reductase n=2 Tax=Ajellomyces capsulatus TaxID=5037 RepID=F0UJM3_AJEC8|nr:2-dehydropantoate 2-reductase [Histoplasma capsulatum H143]EGC45766.1 2-dehydropantoate 2-reductase [Histoplasma capsulatum var. duboisii H88]QSS56413.1 2-dehydropantoate 2-reductase [Histoplasma capsulatum var. duboisii H88]
MSSSNSSITHVLVVGAGGVGTMACVALERSGRAKITAVLRSNYRHVLEHGFKIDSIDHGTLTSYRPSTIVNAVPRANPAQPFDYVVVTMKNVPETCNIPETIRPAVTPGHTTIVLIQNGIYIEPEFIREFPHCVLLSGASYIGAHQRDGHVIHDDHDRMDLGAFRNPSLDISLEKAKLQEFAAVYTASNAVDINTVDDIVFYRWRKLLWNGSFNPLCAITQLDSAAIRQFGGDYSLIRPAMAEIIAIARAEGYVFKDDVIDEIMEATPIQLSFRPSMLVDVDKGNPVEVEVILGNALRIAREKRLQTPILDNTYRFLKLIQARLLAARGYIAAPKELPTHDFI